MSLGSREGSGVILLSNDAAAIATATPGETYLSVEESWENPPDPVGLNLSSRTKKNHAGEPDENHRRHTEPEEPRRSHEKQQQRDYSSQQKRMENGTEAKERQPR